MLDNLLQRGAGLHLLRCEVVDFGIPAVAQHEPVLGVEHRQALHDVVECRIELVILRPQLLLFELEQLVLLFELIVQPLQLRFTMVELGQRGRLLSVAMVLSPLTSCSRRASSRTMQGRRATDRVDYARC